MPPDGPTAADVRSFLVDHHGQAIDALEPLTAGFWSSAYGYRVDGRDLVVRFGDIPYGFQADRMAFAFTSDDLPVPDVIDIGEAFGKAFAISVRHFGRFLESVEPHEAERSGTAIDRLLRALRAVPTAVDSPVPWPGQGGPEHWRAWLLAGLVDDPERHVHGWRPTIAAEPDVDRVFRACESRVADLVIDCPERRDVVHGDLLHGNVLVTPDASRVTAVFSWKCSVRGDFLFDTAWCTLWGAVAYPGIAAANVWDRTLQAAADDPQAFVDAGARHHCYELQIGASHLGWYAWTGDVDRMASLARYLDSLLERGPLP